MPELPATGSGLDAIGESAPSTQDPKSEKETRKPFDKLPTFTHLRNNRFEQQTAQLRREHWFRLMTAVVVFLFVLLWLLAVFVLLIMCGCKALDLPEKVIIALLATTSVNVIALLAAVVRYLFPAKPLVFGHDTLPVTRGGGKPKRKTAVE